MRLGLVERDEPAVRTRAPERRLVMVQEVRANARGPPGAARLHAGEAVFSLEMRERLPAGHRPRTGERAHRGREAPGELALPREVRLAERRTDEPVVAPCHQVQRLPHHGRSDDGGTHELTLERLAPEARRARPDPDVRRRRRLRLHPHQPLDRSRR
jgi:hypothetical protein